MGKQYYVDGIEVTMQTFYKSLRRDLIEPDSGYVNEPDYRNAKAMLDNDEQIYAGQTENSMKSYKINS